MNAATVESRPLQPPTAVPPELLRRHLCLPDTAPLSPQVQALVERTQSWFHQHGRPWATSCEVPVLAINGNSVHFATSHVLSSQLVAHGFREAAVEAMVVLAITAGAEVDQAVTRHWEEGRPDEAMFLNAYAIAFVEHARHLAAVEWAAHAERRRRILLPRYSPGYDGWDLMDQAVLFELVSTTEEFRSHPDPPLKLLEHGGLQPARSTLTMHGMSPRRDLSNSFQNWWQRIAADISDQKIVASPRTAETPGTLYALSVKALRKWAANRLAIETRADGQIVATFRFSGTTCANMGVPFEIDYSVTARQEPTGDYRIEDCRAAPTTGDQGHKAMCAFLDDPRSFLPTVSTFDRPIGRTLDEMIQWSPDISPAGCLCTPASQHHKWRIVLQTLHFALHQGDSAGHQQSP